MRVELWSLERHAHGPSRFDFFVNPGICPTMTNNAEYGPVFDKRSDKLYAYPLVKVGMSKDHNKSDSE